VGRALLTAIDVGGTEWRRTKHTYLQSLDNIDFTFIEKRISRDPGGSEERG